MQKISFYNKQIFLQAIAGCFLISACSHFNGIGNYKSPDEYPSSTPKDTSSNLPKNLPEKKETLSAAKKAKILKDLDKENKEAYDEQSDEELFEKLASPKIMQSKRQKDQIQFAWPVDEARLSRGYIVRKRKHHWGLDLAAPKNTPILAAESGYVVYIGKQFKGYGKLIVIEHNDRWASLYAHLNSFSVKEGDFVEQGQVIGKMGRTGHATGVHLHFEIRDNLKPIDPLVYMPAVE